MANETIGVNVKINTNVQGSIAELKQLKKQLKETAAGSADFKRLANQIDDLEDKIKGAKQGAGDWVDQLASAPGPLGMVGTALNKVKVATVSWGTALKATGIGLVVAAIGGLIAAFAQSEKATKKLQPLLIGFQKIFQGIYNAVEPLFNSLVDLATQAMPYVTKSFSVAYSAIASFLQGIGKIGQAVGKLIKGDFVGAWDSAKEAVTGFGKRYDEANARFEAGTKELTKTEKEELEKRKEAAEKAAEERKEREEKERAEELKRITRQQEARRALLQNYSDAETKRLEQERLKREADFNKDTQAILKKTIDSADQVRATLGAITSQNISNARDQYISLLTAEGEATNETYKQQLARYNQIRELERQKLVDRKATQAELDAFDIATKKGEKDRDEAAAATKLQIISGALGSIAQAVGENTVAGKALAIAQASIDTYAGANKALATYPPPFGAIAAGTVILGGLLNVKKILSTKLPKVPGANVRDVSGAAPTASAPIVPQAPLVNTRTQLDSQTIQQMGSASARAYVVESDITNSQERIRRINRAARLA